MHNYTLSMIFLGLITLSFNAYSNIIQKSANDTRQYQSFTLANQLKVLVISDPKTTKAAASLNVQVGSVNNPIERPGLAHFLEHMLFLGTEKYPAANEYSSFIDSHGGSQNAFTSQENTNYYFDIKQDSLAPALDRFSQFFISPLFSEEYTQREKQAVHSEYQSRLQDDAQRNYGAFKQIMNPKHPGSRFFIGSLATLSDTHESKIRDDLISFYQQQYSANLMTLVVLGKQSVGELKALVTQYFSAIENKDFKKNTITQQRIKKEDLPAILNVKTLKDFRLLTLTFPTPSNKSFYNLKPLGYISSILGYEGQGSLIAYLKAQGLANGLSASASSESEVESAFQTRISLTPKGYKNVDLVIENFFNFVDKIKDQGIQESLYLEEQQLAEQAFQFISRQNPASYVVKLSQNMPHLPQRHWLNSAYLLEKFDQQLISSFVNYITPDNMLINIQAKEVTTNKTEPFFGAEYSTQSVTEKQLQQWLNPKPNTELFIRSLNPYISDDLSLVDRPADNPMKAVPINSVLTNGVNLWHLQDTQFLTPKSTLYFSLIRPKLNPSTKESLALSLYARLINDYFNKDFYDASSAGIYLNLYSHRRGISVKISGYSQNQVLLVKKLSGLNYLRFDQKRFEIIRDNFSRSLTNALRDKPYQQLFDKLADHLLDRPSVKEKLVTLENIKLKDIENIARSLLAKAELRILSHGNISAKEAHRQAQLIISTLNIQQTITVADSEIVKQLNDHTNTNIKAPVDSSDTAVIWYLQGADKSFKERAATNLLSEIIATEYSNQLRTEQQLGYLVFANSLNVQKMPGIALVVQSPSASVEEISASNLAFLELYTKLLNQLSMTELNKFKHSLITRYRSPEQTIYQRSNRFWSELNYKILTFDERPSMIEAVSSLSKKEIIDSWKKMQTKRITLTSAQ